MISGDTIPEDWLFAIDLGKRSFAAFFVELLKRVEQLFGLFQHSPSRLHGVPFLRYSYSVGRRWQRGRQLGGALLCLPPAHWSSVNKRD